MVKFHLFQIYEVTYSDFFDGTILSLMQTSADRQLHFHFLHESRLRFVRALLFPNGLIPDLPVPMTQVEREAFRARARAANDESWIFIRALLWIENYITFRKWPPRTCPS